QQRIEGLKANFMAHGASPDVALQKAYQALDFTVMKQATVLSYMDIFIYLGLLFLCCIPIILLIRQGKSKVDMSEALH
ncbi:MAG TPA: hypothetical protein VK183_07480, partial [Flavobacterium sp.]|nr:hypothetical protein [Flavobacterium sp.]